MDLVIEKIEGTPYSRIRRVPLVSTGIEYQLGTGPKTFSEEDLQDAVEAYKDPGVTPPRLKIGHLDSRFNSPEFDGEPAIGRIENLVLGNAGQTVYGDYVTFDWLAQLIPLAYPGRSIEAGTGVQMATVMNHSTVTGRKYRMVINGVALLGIVWPGCSTLEDLPLLARAEGPPGLEVRGTSVNAAMNIESVRTAFYDSIKGDTSKPFWWIRGMRVEGDAQLIVDDDQGHLYRVPVTVDGDNVIFGEPSQVNVDYKDVPAQMAAGIAASAMLGDEPGAIIYASRAESRPQPTTGGQMDRATLCASLGLPSDASDDQIDAATRAAMVAASGDPATPPAEPVTPPADPPADPATPATPPADPPATPDATPPADPPAEGDPPADPPAEGNPPLEARAVSVDREAFASMQRTAALYEQERAERLAREDAQYVEACIKEGRVPPSSRESYIKQMAAAREATRTFLASLSPNVVPVTERGTTGADGQLEASNGGGLPGDWFPEIERRKQQGAVRARLASDGNYGELKEGVNA